MLRLTVTMCAAIYAGLVIYSDPAPGQNGAVQANGQAAKRTAPTPSATMTQISTRDGRSLVVAAVIDPSRAIDQTGQVALVQTPHIRAAMTQARPAPTAAPLQAMGEVTGAAVNLRAGPSTAEQVVTALVRGDRVEMLGDTGDGWALVRMVTTGTEGFMANRFLAPLN